jgi:hypothetical protein
MTDHAEFIPSFRAQIRAGRGGNFVMCCRITGDDTGFRASERKFSDIDAIISALEGVKISQVRYREAIKALGDHAASDFAVDLNEAQQLSIIQTDSTE